MANGEVAWSPQAYCLLQISTRVVGVPSGRCPTTVSIMCLPSSESEKTLVLLGCPAIPAPITRILLLGMVIDTTSTSTLPVAGEAVPSG